MVCPSPCTNYNIKSCACPSHILVTFFSEAVRQIIINSEKTVTDQMKSKILKLNLSSSPFQALFAATPDETHRVHSPQRVEDPDGSCGA